MKMKNVLAVAIAVTLFLSAQTMPTPEDSALPDATDLAGAPAAAVPDVNKVTDAAGTAPDTVGKLGSAGGAPGFAVFDPFTGLITKFGQAAKQGAKKSAEGFSAFWSS